MDVYQTFKGQCDALDHLMPQAQITLRFAITAGDATMAAKLGTQAADIRTF
jgi:hypothetical protein